MDLFTPIVKEKRLHPLFKRVIQDKTYKPAIAVINEWSNGLLGRKGEAEKFIKEFQTTFNSSLWELYLTSARDKDVNLIELKMHFTIRSINQLFLRDYQCII